LADSSSAEISSRYRSGTVPEGPCVSLVVMKTCRSGEPRLESLVATSVGVCSPAGASGVPSWKGSRARRRSVSSLLFGLRACGLASRRVSRRV
jgi:hypothetical protein